jgi:hypothetical protein
VVPANGTSKVTVQSPTAGNWLYVEFTDVLMDWNFTCGPFGNHSHLLRSELLALPRSVPVDANGEGACPAGVTYRPGEKIKADKLGKEMTGVSLAQCCSQCADNPQCLFFSSAKAQGNNPAKCWLHSGNASGYEKVRDSSTVAHTFLLLPGRWWGATHRAPITPAITHARRRSTR